MMNMNTFFKENNDGAKSLNLKKRMDCILMKCKEDEEKTKLLLKNKTKQMTVLQQQQNK